MNDMSTCLGDAIMDKMIDHNLSLQYLFHLKTLEYGRKQAVEEMQKSRREISLLKNEISHLALSKDCGSKPSNPIPLTRQPRFKLSIAVLMIFSIMGIYLFVSKESIWIACLAVVLYFAIQIKNIDDEYKSEYQTFLHEIEKYNARCTQEQTRLYEETALKAEKEKLVTEKQEALDSSMTILEKINGVRDLLYSIDIIPYQFRDLKSISFFYNQVQSSIINLTDLILYTTDRVEDGYKKIPYFVKEREYLLALYTIQQPYFWDSCELVVKKINEKDTEFAQNTGNTLSKNLQELITIIKQEGLGVKYQFNGNIGIVGNNAKVKELTVNDKPTTPSCIIETPMQEYSTVDEKTIQAIIEQTCSNLVEKLREAGLMDDQLIKRKFEELQAQMPIRKEETTYTWLERIWNAVTSFSEIAGIGSLAFDVYTHFNK